MTIQAIPTGAELVGVDAVGVLEAEGAHAGGAGGVELMGSFVRRMMPVRVTTEPLVTGWNRRGPLFEEM